MARKHFCQVLVGERIALGPEEEVTSQHTRKILYSKVNPIAVPPLAAYPQKPDFDLTGRNNSDKGLPFKLIGRHAMYRV
ncbi:hypothetical protein [Adhaeribacter pallidiroseus]|nr:hypothetical protein [Adhaeribacter pallidiroseus]